MARFDLGSGGILRNAWNWAVSGSVDSLILLETIDSPYTAAFRDGTLVTVFRWHGCRSIQSREELEEAALALRDRLAGSLSNPGHAVSVTFLRDPVEAREDLEREIGRQEAAATRMQLDVSDIMAERRRVVPALMAHEMIILAAYTTPAAGLREVRDETAEVMQSLHGMPAIASGQIPGRIGRSMRQRHDTFTDALARDFVDCGQDMQMLPVVEAVRLIRCLVGPHTLAWADSWTPRGGSRSQPVAEPLGSDSRKAAVETGRRRCSAILRLPESIAGVFRGEGSHAVAEPLYRQLIADHWRVLSPEAVRVGERLFAGFDLALSPEILVEFDELVRHASDVGQPDNPLRWRAGFLIEPGGLAGEAFKRFMVSAFVFLNATRNRRIREAFEELKEMDGADDTIVRLRMSFATWTDTGDLRDLTRQSARLRRAVERWGNSRTDRLSGDPVACVLGSVAGIGCQSTAVSAAAPLSSAVALLPLNRPASPWQQGSLLLRSMDGRTWPYQPGSPQQIAWCDLVTGAPGSGKSVLMNTMNFAAIMAPAGGGREGAARLPRVGILDIHHSSMGLIHLLRDALPAARRHEAAHVKLRNSADHAVNIFDCRQGCRAPTTLELDTICNFISILMTSDDGKIVEGMPALIRDTVTHAFQEASDSREAKRWVKGESPEIDDAISSTGMRTDENTTWWEVVDHLGADQLWHLAALAQRRAAPVLGDLSVAVQAPKIADRYKKVVTPSKETLIEAFQRMLQGCLADFPILGRPTRFDLGETRVIAIDLADVTSSGTTIQERRRSALMYMLGRHVIMQNWVVDRSEIISRPDLPECWRDRHRMLDSQDIGQPKRFCVDEFHRTGGLDGIQAQIRQDFREGRKHNVQIVLASQFLRDFSSQLTDMATGVWLCGSTDAELARDRLNLNERQLGLVKGQLNGPGPAGAPVFAVMRLKRGDIRQLLVSSLGPLELWAYSTTAEDVALRGLLSRLVGAKNARRILALHYPGGSARDAIEEEKILLVEEGLQDDGRGIIQRLATKLADKATETETPAP